MGLTPALTLYRNLLKLAKALPPPKRIQSIVQIKEGFRAGKNETNKERIQEMLTKAGSSLGYLKIVTPRSAQGNAQVGRTTMMFGEEKASGSRPVTNWTGKNMDPDSVRKHNNFLKSAGFQSNKDVKGIF